MVSWAVHPADRRSEIVTVTSAGAQAAALAERTLGEAPAALLDLPAADLAALDQIVATLLGEPSPAQQRPAGIRARVT